MPPRRMLPPAPLPVMRSPLRRVPVTVKAQGAREVVLTGDFTGWAIDKVRLAPVKEGEWLGQLELAPGEYQYRLIVDGQWRDHPEAAKKVPNPYGSENCVLTVS